MEDFLIEVYRNSIIVRNIDTDSQEYRKAVSTFSTYDRVYRKYTFSAFLNYNNDLYFPASIGLQRIQSVFPKEDVQIDYTKKAKAKQISFQMIHEPRDELQEKAIKFLMTMKKDTEGFQRFLSLETGCGKTYVTINAISKFRKKALIVVDTLDLAAQWKREFLAHSNLIESDIVILSGQESVDKEISNPSGKIYIAIHRTLGNILNNDMNGVNNLMNKLRNRCSCI